MKGKETDVDDCHKPPGKPTNPRSYTESASSTMINWTPSAEETGGVIKYEIRCMNCPVDQNLFPDNTTTERNIFKLDGLGSYAKYKIRIVATDSNSNNLVNYQPQSYVELSYTTKEGKPGAVQNFKQTVLNDGAVKISWKPPFAQGTPDLEYQVIYGDKDFKTKETSVTIDKGTSDKNYLVRVMASNKYGKGPTAKIDAKVVGGVPLNIYLGVAGGVLFVVILILTAIFLVWKRRHPAYTQVVRMEDGTVKLPGFFSGGGGKLYVDPTTYNDVETAVGEHTKEIKRTELVMGLLIGGGEFADVYKAVLTVEAKTPKDVAVKILKQGAQKSDRDDFLSEAAILGQFLDANVINLEGVILRERPNMIILEFMDNGALDKYLQDNDMQFTVLQLLGMARGVTSGMKYLSEMGFIHRDLAARNVLVDENRICKIADFGMSRELKVDNTYDTRGGKIPVRWTAPEAIQFKKFTTASDVWSYGVLLWEIMSYGERPYWDWGNYEVLERINSGYRLPPPMSCPKVVHDMMLECWSKDRMKRPKFSEVRSKIDQWIRSPDLLSEIASVVTKIDENLDYTVMQTINKWLEAIGMGKYTENFLDKGYATPRQIMTLTMEDLETQLEIGPIGHRKKIHKAIQNTKSQVEAQADKSGKNGKPKPVNV